jgi:D5 N terminal like
MSATVAEILQKNGLHPASTEPGRYYTTCPKCSASRSRAHQRSQCVGVTIDDKGVRWGCNHCGWSGPEKGSGNGRGDNIAATYDYPNADGKLLFQKVRNPPGHEPRFWCRQPDGRGGWINNTKGVSKPLYRWPEIVEAIALGHEIAIAEGEKDCDNLWRIGIPATTNFDGAADITKNPNVKPKWKSEYSEQLRGARLIVFSDNDPQGQAHADAICRMSSGIAKRVRRLDLALHWPEMPRGADVSDWIAGGHTREELDALIAQAPDYSADGSMRDDMDGGGATKTTTGHDVRPPMFSDDALALRFADQHVGDLRYVADWGKWLSWDGARWQIDRTLAVFDRARAICRAAAAGCNKPKLAKELASARTRAAVVSMAREDRRLAATVEQWDAKPWFFNTGDQHE